MRLHSFFRHINIYIALAATVAVFSCSTPGGRKEVADAVPVKIERFDSLVTLYPRMDSSERAAFRGQYAPAIQFALQAQADSASVDSLLTAYVESRVMTVFGTDISQRFREADSVENQLGLAKVVVGELFPRVVWPQRIIGVVSPYRQSIMFTDSCVLVGLNHYLGRDYAGYGYFEPYQRRLKDPEQLPVRLVESVIAMGCPYRGGDESTVLSRMLHDGAVLWGVKQALPDTPDSVLMGWSVEQTEWVNENLPQIWQTMIERNLLFTTDKSVGDRLTHITPATTLVNPQAPGRLGSYIGMLIVDRFLDENKQAEPKQMLDSAVYNSPATLVKSGFAPQMRR